MATYYHGGSEIQADGLQTLYLMNPGYVGYSDTQTPSNMVLLNHAGNPLNPPSFSNQHLVGIPLPAQDPDRQSIHNQHDISAVHGLVPRVHYNLWTPSIDPTANNHHRILSMVNNSSLPSARQGLSLSLSSQQPAYGSYRSESDVPTAQEISPTSGDEIRFSGSSSSASASASAVSNGINGIANLNGVLMGNKYLKVAQQLLDEVVNVGKGIKCEFKKEIKGQTKINGESLKGPAEGPTAELTTAERQEIQMKKAKLVSMLDEVEQRYRQYHHQMQIVVSSFEAAAGFGSAKTYTALALQTISKQFRCLRDAISGQIRVASKSLGEESSIGGKVEGSRLKFVDHQLRQQRALQQLGVIQHNAWRPQRGLPERSVSVLRAWLFEHFLHPYPKDSDKHLLAKQTGLTRSQVSNWFINARVRLWKPMVEEMYMEETKEQEQNGSDDKTSKSDNTEDPNSSKSSVPQQNSPIRTDNLNIKQDNNNDLKAPPNSISSSAIPTQTNCFSLIRPSDTKVSYHDKEGISQGNPKKVKNKELKPDETNGSKFSMKFGNERQSRDDGYSLIPGACTNVGGFGAYQIGDLRRFDTEQFTPRFNGNGVSLTLGLPHCDNMSLPGSQQSYLSNQNMGLGRRLEMGSEPIDFCSINTPSASHAANDFGNINIQNRKRFAAQLLPDFVA
eukprot:TRINITY_DN10901_c0_g1_i1.p1 TRINITY_DN10901_c0_g1~~TRINITY_DN10901_c0_g1_i1.p1  ORF type:complete len:674 (+),score=88.16 TRINITY_DN10901_c0_g1_i1:314-2335(+)